MPRTPKQVVADGYDTIGESYRPWSDANGTDVRDWFLAQTIARVAKDTDVLELGCGPGVDAVDLSRGRRYVGVDISPVMVALARERVPSATFLCRDLAALAVAAESVDAIVALYVFGHLPAFEHRAVIRSAFGWLRDGGVLCASFPVGGSDDVVEEGFIGVPMFFGGIGREATVESLEETWFVLEICEVREQLDAEGSTESFLWVIARKTSVGQAT